MHFSCGKLERDLTKAAGNVNEMVEEFRAPELTRYSKIKRGARQPGHHVFQPCGREFFRDFGCPALKKGPASEEAGYSNPSRPAQLL